MSDEPIVPIDDNDPLTAPFWPVDQEEIIVLDPEQPDIPVAIDEPTWVRTSAATPPSVDAILRGDYTGWVPLIKAGESLQDAEARAAEKLQRIEAEIAFEESLSTDEIDDIETRTLPSEVLEPIAEVIAEAEPVVRARKTAWTELVEDPDTALSPAQALEEARARIQAMRDSLQFNTRQLAQSFQHPMFDDVAINDTVSSGFATDANVSESPKVEQVELREESIEIESSDITERHPDVVAESPTEVEPHEPIDHSQQKPEPVIADAQPASGPHVADAPAAADKPSAPTVVLDPPKVEHEYISAESIGSTVQEPKAADPSLELMIMRDEIKDLRTRLDASQKLIEDLMHRLTNLTELALKSRSN